MQMVCTSVVSFGSWGDVCVDTISSTPSLSYSSLSAQLDDNASASTPNANAPRGGDRRHYNNTRLNIRVPDTPFNFEESNAKFDKAEIAKEAHPTGASSKPNHNDDEADVNSESSPMNGSITNDANAEDEGFYDRTTSFFDNISCEARDKAEGKEQVCVSTFFLSS